MHNMKCALLVTFSLLAMIAQPAWADIGRVKKSAGTASIERKGARINAATSPSPRDLDGLTVEVKDGQVWIDYERFRSGIAEQVPV